MTQEQIHPNEEEMRINHETLCRIREWAIFMDGSRYCFHEFSNYTNTFEYHEDRASWIYSKIRKTMKSVGLAFFLGLIPGIGSLIYTGISYLKVYLPLFSDFKLDHADHIALRRYARQCFCIDILIGLMFPIAPFIRLRYCSNLMMLEAAKRCVERHDMQSSKAFADCAITSSTVSLPMSKNGQLARHDCMQRNKSLREIGTDYSTLRMTPTTLKGNPAKNSDINFASAPSLLVDSVLTPGQQQKMKSSGGWYYLLGDDSNNNNNNIIQIPPPGAHPRRHRGSEIVYQPYDSLAIKNTVNTHSIDINQKETEKGPMNSSLFLPKTLLPSLTVYIPLSSLIPACRQHHIPPQYYYPAYQRCPEDRYCHQSCPLLTGLNAVTGAGTNNFTNSYDSSLFSSSGLEPGSSSFKSRFSPCGTPLRRGRVSMGALPVVRWRNQFVKYEGPLARSKIDSDSDKNELLDDEL